MRDGKGKNAEEGRIRKSEGFRRGKDTEDGRIQ
jgi:hypothetical protein